ncbi:carboxypeptidase regulatory-like domain-containing protein [Cellulomonas sp. DKR-3]|uniref:alpha-amylase n=1 Tax=Cellulomonas fulva TaxID=2835530 RepID=A0ABS5TV33_9CELL|nr:carboxypeptidase regulatory-like domain-containing protein [Cellulomonas fulva]MBT0993014.1 carboxypeptidase regulatory-like domain-containing protein [Cellulomonas fulva]
MAEAPQRRRPAVSLLAEPGAHAAPGAVATLRVHARNVGTGPLDLVVTVLGLESGWPPVPVAVPAVPADATVTVELPVTPPVGAAGGDYPFVVQVESREPAGARRTAYVDATVHVDAASDLVLTVEPADARAVRSRRVQVVLANTGDRPTTVRLEARPEPGDVRVGLGAHQVDVPPHTSVRIPARASTRRPRVLGHARRGAYHVTATGTRAPQRFDASFTARPLLPGGALRVVAVIGVAVLWIGLVAAALPWVSGRFDGSGDTTAGRTTAPADPGDDGTGTDGDGSGTGTDGDGSGGGDSDGSGDGSGDGDAGADAEGVRVAGAVTSSDPSGVTVQVMPAATLADGATAFPDAGPGQAVPVVATDDTPVGKVSSLAVPVERSDEASERRSTVTGDDGTWAFAGLSATGRYLVVLSKPGYQTVRYWVTGAQAAAVPLEVALEPGRGRLSGVITGPDGAAGGVTVTLSDGTTTVTTRSATEGDVGRWEVDGLSTPTTYLVTASADQLGAQSQLVRLDAAGSASVDLRLSASATTLSGWVTGTTSTGGEGVGLGGVTVTATRGDQARSATTVTGDNPGSFVLPDLAVPGTYTVTVSADGYATQTRTLRLTAATDPTLHLALSSLGGTVDGSTRDDAGAPLAAVGLTLSGPAGTFKTMSASDGRGSFHLDGIPAGDYVLAAESFGHEPASAQVSVRSGKSSPVELELARLEGDGLTATAHVRGRVTDAGTGARITCANLEPDEECLVTVTTTVRPPGEDPSTLKVTASPDAPYELPAAGGGGLYPGLYHLRITVPGYEPGSVTVQVPMGETVEAATVALYPSPSIVGSVSARVGVVPAGTCVVAVDRGADAPGDDPCTEGDVAGSCASDAGACAFLGVNGGYEINRLSSGAYDVYVVPPAGSEFVRPDKVTATLTPGDVRRVDWTLDRLGVLFVNVLASTSTGSVLPAEGAQVWVVDADGDASAKVTANKQGLARIPSLGSGIYRVEARLGSSTGDQGNVSVGLNQEIQTQVVLSSPVGGVEGTVVTYLGAGVPSPVAQALVTVSGAVGYDGLTPLRDTAGPFETESDGSFRVCTVRPCTGGGGTIYLPLIQSQMDVTVSRTGYRTYQASDVSTLDPLLIELQPEGRHFTGSIAFDPASVPANASQLRFDVVTAPPGTGQISVTRSGSALLWSDSAQAEDPLGGRLIRPGHYELVASLPGYTSDTVEFDVPTAPEAVPPVAFSLVQDGQLRLSLVTADGADDGADPDRVENATVTVHRTGATTTLDTPPGSNVVDFGAVPAGSYRVEVRAAGFELFDAQVAVPAGSTAAIPVLVERLGTIVGRVQADVYGTRRDVPGAVVTATKGTEDFSVSSPTGAFTLTGTKAEPGLRQGTWDVEAELEGYTQTAPVQVAIPASSAGPDALTRTADVVMQAQPGSVQVFATDTAGPVDGLTMTLTYRSGDVVVPAISPTCTPTSAPSSTCTPTAGVYVFTALQPVTYTLNISGEGVAPLVVPVTAIAGDVRQIDVSITAPGAGVQGSVTQQNADGTSVPLDGETVRLLAQGADPDTATETTTVDGRYEFTRVPAGTYTISVETDDGLSAQRTLTLQSGQTLVVDLVVSERTYSLTVRVTATAGDLTGALVSITGGSVTPAAQPVVRTGAGVYATTFAQIPAGDWTATVSGPSGHLGTFAEDVSVPDENVVTIAVTETQLVLRATSAEADAPASITATVAPLSGADARSVVLPVGGGDTTLWLPRTGAKVTATAAGWDVTISPAATTTVPVGATFQVVTITLSALATATTLTAPATVDRGDQLSMTAAVTSGGNPVSTGSVRLQRLVAGEWQNQGGAVQLDGDGSVTLTASTTSWPLGSVSLRVLYGGSSGVAASQSGTETVTVRGATTTALAWATGTLTATVEAAVGSAVPTGTVRFELPNGNAVPSCGNVAVNASGVATCAYAQPAAATVITAEFTGTNSWLASDDDVTVPAAPPATP